MNDFALLIARYGYIALVPLAIIEGPLITILAGFFVSLGILNPFAVYAIVVAGDAVGDSALYFLGRWGGTAFFKWVAPRLGAGEEKLGKVKNYFDSHGHKTVTMSKLVHGIGIAGLITAGILKVPYKKYITMCVLVTLGQAAVFLTIGVLFGRAYEQLTRELNYFAEIASVVVVIAGLIFIGYKIRTRSV